MKRNHLAGIIAIVTVTAVAVLQACSGDEVAETSPTTDAGSDGAQTTDTGTPVTDAGSSDASSGIVTFAIPTGGGSVDIPSAAGKITFAFPASAGGKTITLQPSSAAAIGWPADQFVAAIKLGPDGTRFTDPVMVKIEKKSLVGLALAFADTAAKSPAFPLAWDATAGGFTLTHFTTLVLAPPGKICDSQGHQDTTNSASCPDSGATSLRRVTCKGYNFCMTINAECCVDPSVDSGTTCSVEDQRYGLDYRPTEDTSNGQYPYCVVDAGDWDGGDAGCSVAPYYAYNLNGCQVSRDCQFQVFRMECDGGTCGCSTDNGITYSSSFAQSAACDNAATMKTAFVQGCNFPGR